MPRGAPWSRVEVETTVVDYLAMLRKELNGVPYSKAEHRRALLPQLDDRPASAVEFKHPNISAVLEELGYPTLEGYKPRRNYQELIRDVVLEQLDRNRELHDLLEIVVEQPASVPEVEDLLSCWVEAPESGKREEAQVLRERSPRGPPSRVNYVAREARNRKLGDAGEVFVLRYEQARLTFEGQERLASRIRHVSVQDGDAAGYDILSFDREGRERLIEVKTTSFPARTPFYVSQNQVQVSRREAEHFHLYRVFDFRKTPRIFGLPGALEQSCSLDPTEYRAATR